MYSCVGEIDFRIYLQKLIEFCKNFKIAHIKLASLLARFRLLIHDHNYLLDVFLDDLFCVNYVVCQYLIIVGQIFVDFNHLLQLLPPLLIRYL